MNDYENTTAKDLSDLSYKNVEYDLPSSTWYKYADIDPEILRKADLKIFDTFVNLRGSLGYSGSEMGYHKSQLKNQTKPWLCTM